MTMLLEVRELPLAETQAPLGLDDAPAFQPLTDEEAAGIARRAAHLRNEADAIKANAKAMVDDLEGRLEWLLTAEDQRIREWITRHKPGAKSKRTLHGLLGSRTTAGAVKVANHAEALEWCRLWGPEAIVTTETVDVGRIIPEEQLDEPTGEMRVTVPPGFRWDAPKSKLYIQPTPRGARDDAAD